MSIDVNNLIQGHTVITDANSVYDVSRVTRKGSLDVGTLCGATNVLINKWAKYKPVTLKSTVTNTLDTTGDLATSTEPIGSTGKTYKPWKSNATWYKGNGTCGLQVTIEPVWSPNKSDAEKDEATKEREIASLDYWFNNNYQYVFRPAGTMSNPYRLIDFNCYDHNAVPFVKSITPPSGTRYYAGGSGNIEWAMVLPSSTEAKFSLTFEDISPLEGVRLDQCYFGLIFVHVGSQFPGSNTFIYRKYIICNQSYPISNANGKTVTVPLSKTVYLMDSSNENSEQEYLVYPVILTNIVGDSDQPFVLFGTHSGTILPVPNAETFSLTLQPNPLNGSIRYASEELSSNIYSESGTDRVYPGTDVAVAYLPYVLLTNRGSSNAVVPLNNIELHLELWWQSGGSWNSNVSPSSPGLTGAVFDTDNISGAQFNSQNNSITIASGVTASLPFRWVVADSNFTAGVDYRLRQTGTVTYNNGATILLANPTHAPNDIALAKLFQAHVSVDNITASTFRINIWVENITGQSQSFDWSSLKYEVVSYAKYSSGYDYDHPTTPQPASFTGSVTIAANSTSSPQQVTWSPPSDVGVVGYLSCVRVYHSSSHIAYDIGDASVNVYYPETA